MKPKCEFKPAEGIWVSGEDCFVGRWVVGNAAWNCGKSKGAEGVDYRATCKLPGLKANLGAYATMEEAKARIVRAVEFWFEGAA